MRVQKRLQEAVVEVISPLLTEFCEEEVTAKLGRGKRVPRRVSEHVREIDWYCRHCGCRDAKQFTRDGHSRRALETGWGHVDGLQVPMLECQRCGHDVVCTYAILEKYRRFWLDAGSARALWQWVLPEFASAEPGVGGQAGQEWRIAHHE